MTVAVLHTACLDGDHGACPLMWQDVVVAGTRRWWRCQCGCHPERRPRR